MAAERTDRRTVRTTAAVLDGAEALFRERGFHATTIDAIAAAAGVAPGTVLYHFGGKEQLYLALVDRALDLNERYMAGAYDEGRRALEQVLAAGEAYVRFYLDHPGFFRMVALRVLDVPPGDERAAVERRLADRVEGFVDAVADALERAIAEGDAEPVDARRASRFLWGAWNGVLALNLREDRLALSEAELHEVLDLGVRMVVFGMATPAGKRRARKFL